MQPSLDLVAACLQPVEWPHVKAGLGAVVELTAERASATLDPGSRKVSNGSSGCVEQPVQFMFTISAGEPPWCLCFSKTLGVRGLFVWPDRLHS